MPFEKKTYKIYENYKNKSRKKSCFRKILE